MIEPQKAATIPVSQRHDVDCVAGPKDLRRSVRSLIAEVGTTPRIDSWIRGFDASFSRRVGEAGWIGATWSEADGGGGCSHIERLAITEELLRAGAPVAAHWTADRQIGPMVLARGSDRLRAELLPAIRRGEVVVGLGMSEPDAGSDLASVRTRATLEGDTWYITGTKVWTTSAHRATHLYVLARTGSSEDRHEGLVEFLIDADSPGIVIRPILDLVGEHHFNEMVFDHVPAPVWRVLGEVGQGWSQVTEQLAYERGGVERYLSTYPLLAAAVEVVRAHPDRAATEKLGALTARLTAVRHLGVRVAEVLDKGGVPGTEAAELKLAGTAFEKEVVEETRYLLDVCAADSVNDQEVRRLLVEGLAAVPGSSLRGGATEIVRTLVGRSPVETRPFSPELREVVDDVLGNLADRLGESNERKAAWETIRSLGWTGVGVDELLGGEGGTLADVAELAAGIGRHTVDLPLIETGLAVWASAQAGWNPARIESCGSAIAVDSGCLRIEPSADSLVVSGAIEGVQCPEKQILLVTGGKDARALLIDAAAVSFETVPSLGDRPIGRIVLNTLPIPSGDWINVSADLAGRLRDRTSVLMAAAITGALERARALTREHVVSRRQFGRALADLQAVRHMLAEASVETDLAVAAVEVALQRPSAETAAAARVAAARASGVVATIAHQLHGAMGVTREHSLHRATRRLWSWRDQNGTEREHQLRLGQAVLGEHSSGLPDGVLWSIVTGAE